MGVDISVEIANLKKAQDDEMRRLKAIRGGAVFTAVTRGVLIVQRSAMMNTGVVTGRLRAGWNTIVAQYGGGVVLGVIYNRVEYAPYYEFGTHNKDGSVKMAPRAPLRRSMTTNRDRVVAEIVNSVARALT